MKTTAIARIRQIRQSLFARFAGVQTSADHAPDSERKSAAVRQLYRILSNDSNVWVPTQVVADRSTGVFARLRRGVSQRVSALTIRNPFSEESLERTKRAFAFSFIETSLEKRQLLTTRVSQIGSSTSTSWLITISDTSNESANITNNGTVYIVGSDQSVVGGITTIPSNATSITVNANSSNNAISFTVFESEDSDGNPLGGISTAVNITSNIDVTQLQADINAGSSGSITISSSNIVSGSSLTSASGITLVGSITGRLTIDTGAALVLPTGNLTELRVTSFGPITQTGPMTVSGTAVFEANNLGSAGNITLLNPGNDFNKFVAKGTNISVNDSNNITFGDTAGFSIRASGDFTFNQGTSCITVAADAPIDLTGGSGSVNLTGRNIILNADISTAAGDIRLIGNNGTFQRGEFAGVQMTVTPGGLPLNVNTTGGNIVIDGRGGLDVQADTGFGVVIAGSTVQAGGNGSLTITGVSDGWYGIYSSSLGDNSGPGLNFDVHCPNTFTTSNGSITINGIGGGDRRCLVCLKFQYLGHRRG